MYGLKITPNKNINYLIDSGVYYETIEQEKIFDVDSSAEETETKFNKWTKRQNKNAKRRKKPEERKLSHKQKIGRMLEVLETLALDKLGIPHQHTDYENYTHNRKGCDKYIPQFQAYGECKNTDPDIKLFQLFVKRHIIRRYPKKALLKWLLISSKNCLTKKHQYLLRKNNIHIIEVGEQVTKITEELINKVAEQFETLFASINRTSILPYIYHSSSIKYLLSVFGLCVDELQNFSTRYRPLDCDVSVFTVDVLDHDMCDISNDGMCERKDEYISYYERLWGLSRFDLMDKIAYKMLNHEDRSHYSNQDSFISHLDVDDHTYSHLESEQKMYNIKQNLTRQVSYA